MENLEKLTKKELIEIINKMKEESKPNETIDSEYEFHKDEFNSYINETLHCGDYHRYMLDRKLIVSNIDFDKTMSLKRDIYGNCIEPFLRKSEFIEPLFGINSIEYDGKVYDTITNTILDSGFKKTELFEKMSKKDKLLFCYPYENNTSDFLVMAFTFNHTSLEFYVDIQPFGLLSKEKISNIELTFNVYNIIIPTVDGVYNKVGTLEIDEEYMLLKNSDKVSLDCSSKTNDFDPLIIKSYSAFNINDFKNKFACDFIDYFNKCETSVNHCIIDSSKFTDINDYEIVKRFLHDFGCTAIFVNPNVNSIIDKHSHIYYNINKFEILFPLGNPLTNGKPLGVYYSSIDKITCINLDLNIIFIKNNISENCEIDYINILMDELLNPYAHQINHSGSVHIVFNNVPCLHTESISIIRKAFKNILCHNYDIDINKVYLYANNDNNDVITL